MAAAKNIQIEIERLNLEIPASDTKKQTVSIGVVTLVNEVISVNEVITHADSQLYGAKRNGRNMVCDIVL